MQNMINTSKTSEVKVDRWGTRSSVYLSHVALEYIQTLVDAT